MKDKAWEKPKLLVLVRGKPEESVLDLCKHPEFIKGTGPNSGHQECTWATTDSATYCQKCHDSAKT
jgi:hypothetical protein